MANPSTPKLDALEINAVNEDIQPLSGHTPPIATTAIAPATTTTTTTIAPAPKQRAMTTTGAPTATATAMPTATAKAVATEAAASTPVASKQQAAAPTTPPIAGLQQPAAAAAVKQNSPSSGLSVSTTASRSQKSAIHSARNSLNYSRNSTDSDEEHKHAKKDEKDATTPPSATTTAAAAAAATTATAATAKPEEKKKQSVADKKDEKKGKEEKRERAKTDVNMKWDKYGFVISEDDPQNKNGSAQNKDKQNKDKIAKRDYDREKKWLKMIQDPTYAQKFPAKLKQRVRKGVPDCFRGMFWQQLAQSKKRQAANKTLFQEYLKRKSDWEDVISRDINRTFPRHILFRDKKGLGQQNLFNVLKAYALHDPEVGYCQGMGFITGLFLLYMAEEDAFWMLVTLLFDERYEMRKLYVNGMPLVNQQLFQYECLLKKIDPTLYNHLTKESVAPTMYASQWFITVFSYNFPFDCVVRVWDIYLNEGAKIAFRIALALMFRARDKILGLHFEDIIVELKNVTQNIPSEELIQAAVKIDITTAQLKEYEREYKKKQQKETKKSP